MSRPRLLALYDDVERRARRTAEEHPFWPCRRGCDACCRRLAEVPRFTRAEWEWLREGLDALPPATRAQVDARLGALAAAEREGRLGRHVVCPMLDETEGACLVYAHRPLACRTYGFYVRRGDGLHCDLVERAVADHPEAAVVWGNADGAEEDARRLSGEERALTAWLADRA